MAVEQRPLGVIVGVESSTSAGDLSRTLGTIPPRTEILTLVVLPETFDTSDVDCENVQLIRYTKNQTVSTGVNTAFSRLGAKYLVLMAAGIVVSASAWDELLRFDGESGPDLISQQMFLVRPLNDMSHDDVVQISRDGLSERWDATRMSRTDSMGFLACRRKSYHLIRGLDENISGMGVAIEDFIERALRFSMTISWNYRDLEIFRLAGRLNAKVPAEGPRQSDAGRVQRAAPIFRNLRSWTPSAHFDDPLVSVVIATYNRGAYLADCLHSILAQTFGDFEVIVVDDGSTDDTPTIISSFNDPRIVYHRRSNEGISAARNFGTQESKGAFIAVHDDDDIMLPWRLERQLEGLGPGDHGSFGVSIHFDNDTGALSRLVHRKFNVQTALRYGHNPTHPTWLIRKDVFARFRYDETLKSGVDNNIALRMVRSGVHLRHTGESMILRRIHSHQITRTAGEIQSSSAKMSRRMLKFSNGLAEDPKRVAAADEWLPAIGDRPFEAEVSPYLPDHLVARNVVLYSNDPTLDLVAFSLEIGTLQYSLRAETESHQEQTMVEVNGVTMAGLVRLRESGIDYEVRVSNASATNDGPEALVSDWIEANFVRGQPAGSYRVRVIDLSDESEKDLGSLCGLGGFSCQARSNEKLVRAFVSQELSPGAAIEHYRRLFARLPEGYSVSILSVSLPGFSDDFITSCAEARTSR